MLRLPRFRFVSPPTLEEALRLRMEHPDTSMYVAGDSLFWNTPSGPMRRYGSPL